MRHGILEDEGCPGPVGTLGVKLRRCGKQRIDVQSESWTREFESFYKKKSGGLDQDGNQMCD